MLKKAKIYSLLAIVVASTALGVFGFTEQASAQVWNDDNPCQVEPDGTATWNVNVDGVDHSSIVYKTWMYTKRDGAAMIDETTFKNSDGSQAFEDGTTIYVLASEYTAVVDDKPNFDGCMGARVHVMYFDPGVDPLTATTVGYATFGGDNIAVSGYDDPLFDSQRLQIAFDPSDESANVADPTVTDGTITDTSVPPTCQIKGVGWLICPVVNFLAEVTDAAYFLLDRTLLRLEPIALPGSSTGQGMQIYEPWKTARDFANIFFIIGFLVIVFSQITGFGVSNYGIKQLLPKIIVAAILVNISYFICAIAVDLSNILGNNLRGLLMPSEGASLIFEGKYSHNGEDVRFDSTGWQGLAGIILGGAMAAVMIYAFLPVLLPLTISAAVAIFAVIVVLTLRQALVVILIIISPLAFVALLFPNTESYFQKWRTLFTTMLLVYPIISIVFGASALASNILMTSTDDLWVQMVGAGVSIIPLALTPVIMKASGGLLNRWAGLVNDPSKGWIDGKKNALRDRGKIMRADRASRTAEFANNPFSNSTLLGGGGSRRRRLLTWGTNYAASNRERARSDRLDEAESSLESNYLGTKEGKEARNAATNAKIAAQNAQIRADTVRLESPQGVALQQATASTEMKKQIAETKAQTAAISAIPAALAASSREADLGKEIAENTSKVAGLAGANTDLKMRAVTSAEALSATEGRDRQAYEETVAGTTAAGVTAGTAAAARAAREELNTINQATDSAKRVGEQKYAEAIQNDPTLATQAGGIDPYGKSRAESRAAATINKAFDEAVTNEKSTMSKLTPAELSAIKNDLTQSTERRAAATGMLAKNGGAADIMTTWNELGSAMRSAQLSGDTAEIEKISAMQQQFMADGGNRIPGSVTGVAIGAMSTGRYTGGLDGEILSSLREGKYSGEMLAGLHPKELQEIKDTLSAAQAAGHLDATDLAKLSVLQSSITEYKRFAPSIGKGISLERDRPLSGIESL